MSTKVDALAAVTIAVGKAIEAREIREDFLEALKVAFAEPEESLIKKVAEDKTTGPELVAIVSREASLDLGDVLETVTDVWQETERQQKEGPAEGDRDG
jgi:hypothetical protein